MPEIQKIGIFEERILMAIAFGGDNLYGVEIYNALESASAGDVSIGAIYSTLDRLLEKGLVEATVGTPTPERGGRARKYYTITTGGRDALNETESTRMKLKGLVIT